MTESDWASCNDPATMLEFLRTTGKARRRKRRKGDAAQRRKGDAAHFASVISRNELRPLFFPFLPQLPFRPRARHLLSEDAPMIRKLESGEYRCYSGKIAGALFQIGFWPWRVLLAVAVIAVAGRHSSGDDQKPDPPDVTAIIQTIRQAEELFRNMEFAYTWEVIALPSGEQQVEE